MLFSRTSRVVLSVEKISKDDPGFCSSSSLKEIAEDIFARKVNDSEIESLCPSDVELESCVKKNFMVDRAGKLYNPWVKISYLFSRNILRIIIKNLTKERINGQWSVKPIDSNTLLMKGPIVVPKESLGEVKVQIKSITENTKFRFVIFRLWTGKRDTIDIPIWL